jgi:hypothetical protein
MTKAITYKLTKVFWQSTVEAQRLYQVLQEVTDAGGTVMSILQTSTPDSYLVVYVNTKREEVEVEVPDEIEALPEAGQPSQAGEPSEPTDTSEIEREMSNYR